MESSNLRSSSVCVLVAGATGGVGQLTVSKLLQQGIRVRILSRNAQKAEQMFDHRVEIVVGDTRYPPTLPPAVEGVSHIICCTGTTAFPSNRWEFNRPDVKDVKSLLAYLRGYVNPRDWTVRAQNSPTQVDAEGVANLVAAAPSDLKRFVFVSSCGILRKGSVPYNVLNTFGVLDAKQQGEAAVIQSGLPYTIIRPGRLIDGPYTSYDLNTLLKAKTDGQLAVVVGTGDTLSGQTSRIDLATACVECLCNSAAAGQVFELVNQGVRPAVIDWDILLAQISVGSSGRSG